MNENMKVWIEDLRSGKYPQGRGVLKKLDASEYCCLGVACDRFRRDTGKGEFVNCQFRIDGRTHDYTFVPDEVREYFGFDEDLSNELVNLNDAGNNYSSNLSVADDGYSFDQIADYIEAKFS